MAWIPQIERSVPKNNLTGHWQQKRWIIVSDTNLIDITATAVEAFKDFDWNEHEGKGVRLFVQGFG